jgi:cellulose biosynthesis protein BcsQ
MFLPRELPLDAGRDGEGGCYESFPEVNLVASVRNNLDLIASGNELKHFLWGRGAQVFARKFAALLKELTVHYDNIVIDTPPDFNVLSRNAIANADIVAVPVDASEMSIHSLEELIFTARHIRRPTWAIVRTMVNKQAARTVALSNSRLNKRLEFAHGQGEEGDEPPARYNVEDPKEFLRMLQDWEQVNGRRTDDGAGDERPPLYLLGALIYRTERQNQLSFLGKTSFDSRQTAALGEQYLAVARELEGLIASSTVEEESAFPEGQDPFSELRSAG